MFLDDMETYSIWCHASADMFALVEELEPFDVFLGLLGVVFEDPLDCIASLRGEISRRFEPLEK